MIIHGFADLHVFTANHETKVQHSGEIGSLPLEARSSKPEASLLPVALRCLPTPARMSGEIHQPTRLQWKLHQGRLRVHRQIKCTIYPQSGFQISDKDQGLNGMSVILVASFRTLHCFSLTLLRSSSLVVKTATLRVFPSHWNHCFLVTCELAYSRLVEDDGFSKRYLTGWEPPMDKCANFGVVSCEWPETALAKLDNWQWQWQQYTHDWSWFTDVHYIFTVDDQVSFLWRIFTGRTARRPSPGKNLGSLRAETKGVPWMFVVLHGSAVVMVVLIPVVKTAGFTWMKSFCFIL